MQINPTTGPKSKEASATHYTLGRPPALQSYGSPSVVARPAWTASSMDRQKKGGGQHAASRAEKYSPQRRGWQCGFEIRAGG